MNERETAPDYRRQRFPPEIICPQTTKTRVLAARGGRDDVANLGGVIGHDDTVDEGHCLYVKVDRGAR